MTPPLIAAFSLLFGAAVGSFLNVCIYRLPRQDLSINRPRASFCPSCGHPVRWFDNIPVVSWLLLAGRCRDCGTRISGRYPLVEALTAALFVTVVMKRGGDPYDLTWLAGSACWLALLSVLIVITFIDIDHRIIPDELSVTGTAVLPLAAYLLPGMPVEAQLPSFLGGLLGRFPPFVAGGGWGALVAGLLLPLLLGGGAMALFRRFSTAWDGSRRTWWDTRLAGAVGVALGILLWVFAAPATARDQGGGEALAASLLGMGVGSGVIYLIAVLGKLAFRKEAMGFGDVKLMGLLGAALGWKPVLLALLIACLLGSVIGIGVRVATRSSYIPFGPFLSGGAAIMIIWRDWVDRGIEWYLGLFQ